MNKDYKLLYFTAPWCTACKAYKSTVWAVASTLNVELHEYNVANNMEIATSRNVRSVPTVLVEQAGAIVGSIRDALPYDTLLSRINEVMA
jgi:thiol-disulfide isomerase/thioredoxin